MKTLLALIAMTFVGMTTAAHASTLTLDVLLGPGGTEVISAGSPLASNINLTNITTQFSKEIGASLSGGVLTVGNGSPKSIYGYADYTVVPTVAVSQPNIFGFSWLNPSTSTSVQVVTADTLGGTHSYSLLGSDFSSYISAGNALNINIIDPLAVLTSIEFDSLFGNGTTSGFKVSSFAIASNLSAVPLPGTLGLFLTAIAGLYFMRRKAII